MREDWSAVAVGGGNMPLSLFGSRRKWLVGNSFDGQTRQEETTKGEGEPWVLVDLCWLERMLIEH